MKPAWSFVLGLLLLAGTPVLPVPSSPLRLPTPAPAPGPVSPNKATSAIYVYEKDEAAIPVGVTAGINKLNSEKKVIATLFEKDTVDGTGQTPDQYKPALDAARAASIPSLVVLSGTSVVKVVKAPKTEAEVLSSIP